jgi:hypothetical protein
MELKTIETPWSSITWEDMTTLAICLALDLLDYIVPFMATPVYGDILDFTGIVFCMLFFNWVGAVTFLEIIPGTDIIPIFSITWLSWYINISRVRRKKLEQELEQWK